MRSICRSSALPQGLRCASSEVSVCLLFPLPSAWVSYTSSFREGRPMFPSFPLLSLCSPLRRERIAVHTQITFSRSGVTDLSPLIFHLSLEPLCQHPGRGAGPGRRGRQMILGLTGFLESHISKEKAEACGSEQASMEGKLGVYRLFPS